MQTDDGMGYEEDEQAALLLLQMGKVNTRPSPEDTLAAQTEVRKFMKTGLDVIDALTSSIQLSLTSSIH